MGRYVAEYTIGQPDDFIRLVSEDYFQKEGFKLVPYKGEMLWKKGRGVLTAPQYIKLAYGQGIVHVEAFIRWTILPGVYVGEMALDNGFVGAIPKSMLMDKVNTLLRLLSQPMPAAAPAGGRCLQRRRGLEPRRRCPSRRRLFPSLCPRRERRSLPRPPCRARIRERRLHMRRRPLTRAGRFRWRCTTPPERRPWPWCSAC